MGLVQNVKLFCVNPFFVLAIMKLFFCNLLEVLGSNVWNDHYCVVKGVMPVFRKPAIPHWNIWQHRSARLSWLWSLEVKEWNFKPLIVYCNPTRTQYSGGKSCCWTKRHSENEVLAEYLWKKIPPYHLMVNS